MNLAKSSFEEIFAEISCLLTAILTALEVRQSNPKFIIPQISKQWKSNNNSARN